MRLDLFNDEDIVDLKGDTVFVHLREINTIYISRRKKNWFYINLFLDFDKQDEEGDFVVYLDHQNYLELVSYLKGLFKNIQEEQDIFIYGDFANEVEFQGDKF
ncbi:MAG: hypothetical protein EU548_09735 [Promethearchaeota archaeon]|nr:MAG: hypothetical protein EU548_09735 [Candidatus Lokiarchaeota archaeon]